jgi:dihydroorotate dehydrogenase
MPDLYPIARTLLWRLPPEVAHKVALCTLRAGLGRLTTTKAARRPDPQALEQRLWGLHFPNPIGVAAGFDKDGLVPNAILDLGFGSVEVGTVTPRPQVGNRGPRLFRLDGDNAIVNSMGFPSAGLDVVARRLAKRQKRRGMLGINLGKNRDTEDAVEDYAEGIRRMAPLADYLVVNVSSPNTPGLRDLQRREPLESLLRRLLVIREETGVRPPLLVKIAPDLTTDERADIAAVAISVGIDGMVIANTTVTRPVGLIGTSAAERGGLSGRPLFDLSTELLSQMYHLTGGHIPLIGVGGVSTAEDAYAKIRAGASLVQLHTALIFAGMNLVGDLKNGLARLLQADGFTSVAGAVGADHRDAGLHESALRPASASLGVPPSPRLRGEGRGEGQFTPLQTPA